MSDEEDCGFFKEESKQILEDNNYSTIEDSGVLLPVPKHDRCFSCQSIPIEKEISKIFKMSICYTCSRKLKFITKTTCKERYLLTEEELKQFGYLLRPNPLKGTWNDMQLYLESEIKDFSIQKFGTEEEIEKIKDDKKEKRKQLKLKKIKNRVKELKRRTFLKPSEEKHKHKFEPTGSKNISKCSCGMTIDEEEL